MELRGAGDEHDVGRVDYFLLALETAEAMLVVRQHLVGELLPEEIAGVLAL